MELHLEPNAADWSLEKITNWTAEAARRIASNRKSRDNPGGWSPTSRLLMIRLKILGTLLNASEQKRKLGSCYKAYRLARADMKRIELNEDEKEWLSNNGITDNLPEFRLYREDCTQELLIIEIMHIKKITTSKRREELRLLHGGWMRRIQDEADAGKIGNVLRNLMGEGKEFTMEVLYGERENEVEGKRISELITDFFKEWFYASEEEIQRDGNTVRMVEEGNEVDWKRMGSIIGINEDVAKRILEGMKDKEISAEGKLES